MRQTSFTPLLLATLTVAFALSGSARAAPPQPKPQSMPPKPPSLLSYPASRRYVAATTAPKCPRPVSGAWKTQSAFVGDKSRSSDVPPVFARFCIYTRALPSANPPKFSDIDQRSIERIEADYDVLLPQAMADIQGPPQGPLHGPSKDLIKDLAKSLSKERLKDLGKDLPKEKLETIQARIAQQGAMLFAESAGVTGGGAQAVYDKPGAQPYLAIVDTAAPADGAQDYRSLGFERHGVAMAAIAGAARCPAAEQHCRDRTFLVQAFPYQKETRAVAPSSPQLGGTTSLAQAIWLALQEWRSKRRTLTSTGDVVVSDAPLVLNLSLGWDPGRYGTIPETLTRDHLLLLDQEHGAELRRTVPVGAQMVHAALVYASCLDVLTIAAAGNRLVDGCDAQGPLAPAEWERLSVPTRAQCELLFSRSWLESERPASPAFSQGARALVYAVGGADGTTAEKALLPITRPGSVPPRLVFASHAVSQWHDQWTDAWSGTSVAAAVYSGLAATLWTHFPALSPHQLVMMIDASGQKKGEASIPIAGQATRLINGHAAYEKICPKSAQKAGTCAHNPYMKPKAQQELLGYYQDAIESLRLWVPDRAPQGGKIDLQTKDVDLGCHRHLTHYYPSSANSGALPLTAHQFPWVRPQPETPICSSCPIKGGKLILSLNPDARGSHWSKSGPIILTNPTLHFRGRLGWEVSVNLGDLKIEGDAIELDLGDYTVAHGSKDYPLPQALALAEVYEGTLTLTVPGADGQPASLVSVVQVLQ